MSAEGARPAAPPPAPKPRPNPGPPRTESYPPIPPHIARRIGLIVQPAIRAASTKDTPEPLARAA